MKNNALTYSLKIWLTGLLVGSLWMLPSHPDKLFTFLPLLGLIIFSGFFLSFPSFIILFLLSRQLNKTTLKVIPKKFILSVNGLVLTLLAYLLTVHFRFGTVSDFHLFIPYAIVIVIGVWLYKLDPPFDSVEDTVSSEE